VKGEWKYLYRAIDESGHTIDFYLSHRRNAKAVKYFLKKLIKSNPICDIIIINTYKNPANATIKGFVRLLINERIIHCSWCTSKC
jgi:transposase, IS6 family